jgi:hypothetical protein
MRTVAVRAEGYVPESWHVEVAARTHVKVPIALRPSPPDSPPEAPPAANVAATPAQDRVPPSHSSRPAGPLAVGTAGLTAVGVGAYFGVRTIQLKNARDSNCTGGACAPAARDYDSEARRAAAISDVAVGAGLAALAAGAVWWWLASKRPDARDAWRASPLLGPTLCGMVVERTLR